MRVNAILCDLTRFRDFIGLAVTATGSTGATIYHASPSVELTPWYDDVLVLDSWRDEVNQTDPILHAGRIRAFVSVKPPRSANGEVSRPHVLMLVHAYRTAKSRPGRAGGVASFEHDIGSPAAMWSPEVPYPYMRFAMKSSGKPLFWLLDTETISSGVWVTEDFDRPGNYIFIRHS